MGRLAALRKTMWPFRRAGRTGVLISVTRADIEAALHEGRTSPLALAIGRQLRPANVKVSSDAVTIVWTLMPPDVEIVSLPGVARYFNKGFSLGIPMKPFTFQLTQVSGPRTVAGSVATLILPGPERAFVQRIRDRAQEIVGRAGEFSPRSKDLYIARRVLATYLPETIATYSALPAEWSSQALSPDGRTGIQVLHDELTLIETELDAIAGRLDRAKLDRVLTNERFLESQLGGEPPEPPPAS